MLLEFIYRNHMAVSCVDMVPMSGIVGADMKYVHRSHNLESTDAEGRIQILDKIRPFLT